MNSATLIIIVVSITFVILMLIMAFQKYRQKLYTKFAEKSGFYFNSYSKSSDSVVDMSLPFFRYNETSVLMQAHKSGKEYDMFVADIIKYFTINLHDRRHRRRTQEMPLPKGMVTVFILKFSFLDVPTAYLYPESLLDRSLALIGAQDIDFDDDRKFSNRFTFQGTSEASIRQFFGPRLRKELMNTIPPKAFLEISEESILLCTGKLCTHKECIHNVHLLEHIYKCFKTYDPNLDKFTFVSDNPDM